jgi:hypothetical protein
LDNNVTSTTRNSTSDFNNNNCSSSSSSSTSSSSRSSGRDCSKLNRNVGNGDIYNKCQYSDDDAEEEHDDDDENEEDDDDEQEDNNEEEDEVREISAERMAEDKHKANRNISTKRAVRQIEVNDERDCHSRGASGENECSYVLNEEDYENDNEEVERSGYENLKGQCIEKSNECGVSSGSGELVSSSSFTTAQHVVKQASKRAKKTNQQPSKSKTTAKSKSSVGSSQIHPPQQQTPLNMDSSNLNQFYLSYTNGNISNNGHQSSIAAKASLSSSSSSNSSSNSSSGNSSSGTLFASSPSNSTSISNPTNPTCISPTFGAISVHSLNQPLTNAYVTQQYSNQFINSHYVEPQQHMPLQQQQQQQQHMQTSSTQFQSQPLQHASLAYNQQNSFNYPPSSINNYSHQQLSLNQFNLSNQMGYDRSQFYDQTGLNAVNFNINSSYAGYFNSSLMQGQSSNENFYQQSLSTSAIAPGQTTVGDYSKNNTSFANLGGQCQPKNSSAALGAAHINFLSQFHSV